MNRRTFIALTGITTLGLPTLPIMAKQKPRWIPVVRTLPNVGQRIALVLFPLKEDNIQRTSIHIGKVMVTNHRSSPSYEPKITLKEEMRYQNYDENGLFPGEGYALWYKRNLPYDPIKQAREMKCLKSTVWWGGEHKLGTVYVWHYRNGEPSFEWWAPIDKIPDVLPTTPLEIYNYCRKKTKEAVKKWIPFKDHLPNESDYIEIRDQSGVTAKAHYSVVIELVEKKKYHYLTLDAESSARLNTTITGVNERFWSWRYNA